MYVLYYMNIVNMYNMFRFLVNVLRFTLGLFNVLS